MAENRFEEAATDFRQLPSVIECVVWSDCVAVRCSGSLYDIRQCGRNHDLYPRNVEGVLYADPIPTENDAGELDARGDTEPASVVAEADSVRAAHIVEEDGDRRLLVTTPGVEDAVGFMELNGPYGWMITEAKEAQIRFAPPMSGASYLISRSTSQLRHLDR